MPDRLLVFGSGGHAKVVIEAARASNPSREIVILDDDIESRDRTILGIPVYGTREELDALRGSPVIVAVGDNAARAALMDRLRSRGHSFACVIHPRAIIADSVIIGEGVFVSAGAAIIAEARIGSGAIVNTGATIDHDCNIGEAAHIAPGVHLCGNVSVGARTLIGVGSAVRPGISITSDVLIGAGSVVIANIEAAGTFLGNPARALRRPGTAARE
jgi:UDP-perosamine 4-acetyltransferase